LKRDKSDDSSTFSTGLLYRPPKEHFDHSLANFDGIEIRKVGRPFKGRVEEYTKEPHVPERRSILRGFKKFYSRKEFENII
jgi:hypothetical protein